MKAKFNVTFETVTEESAEHGEAAEHGFVLQGCSFREAVDEIGGCAIEADCWPVRNPRWFTTESAMNYHTGEWKSFSLHLPASITSASRMRIARLLGVID